MNLQPRHRLGIVLCLLTGFGLTFGIYSVYQNVSSQPVFPIDKDTLTVT